MVGWRIDFAGGEGWAGAEAGTSVPGFLLKSRPEMMQLGPECS